MEKPINAASLLDGEIIEMHLGMFLKTLAVKFTDESYGQEGSLKFQKAKDVYESAIERNLSSAEFTRYIILFKEGKFYDSGFNMWQEADFFNQLQDQLYTLDQAKAKQNQTGESDIFGRMTLYKFILNGVEKIMYSFSPYLDFEKIEYIEKPKVESMISDFTKDELDLSKILMKSRKENQILQQKVFDLKDEISRMKLKYGLNEIIEDVL